MATKRVSSEVSRAMEIARSTGWPVAIRNDKVVISAPDGMAITIGLSPNEQSLKAFRATARKYDLDGSGPARTPGEKERLVKEAEAAGLKEAEAANRKRQQFEAEVAKKQEKAAMAAKRAAEATEPGMRETFSVREVSPAVTAQKKVSSKAASSGLIPQYDASLLGAMEYGKFLLPTGESYCIECLAQGVSWTAKSPQGLAAHRGMRHQVYSNSSKRKGASVPNLSKELPEDLQAALDLMRASIVEHLTQGDQGKEKGKIASLTEKVSSLEADLVRATEQVQQEKKKAEADYQELKKSSLGSLASSQLRISSLEKTNRELKLTHEREMKEVLTRIQSLFGQMRQILGDCSPVQAVGKIDEMISKYLQ